MVMNNIFNHKVDTKLSEALKGQDPKILDVFFEDF